MSRAASSSAESGHHASSEISRGMRRAAAAPPAKTQHSLAHGDISRSSAPPALERSRKIADRSARDRYAVAGALTGFLLILAVAIIAHGVATSASGKLFFALGGLCAVLAVAIFATARRHLRGHLGVGGASRPRD
jgi:hypothetical protein